jgi:hypothetical protein
MNPSLNQCALALILVSGLATASPGAHGPNGEHLDGAGTAATASGMARLPDGSLQIPKAAQRRMGVRTQMVAEGEHAATVELNAVVSIDPNAGGRLHAGHSGWLEMPKDGFPVLGQAVKKGQVLAILRHKYEPYDIGNQQAQMARLATSRTVAEQRVKRLEELEGSVPQKEIEAARAELKSLSSQSTVISRSLHETDVLVSPATGIIANANVIAGQVVAPQDVLFEIVDPARLTIEANTNDAKLVDVIKSGSIKDVEAGSLNFIGGGRGLKNGTIPLLFRLRDSKTPLIVGQPVTVIAQLKNGIKGIRLPASAVVRNPNNEPIVWIKSGALRFIPQPVEIRPLDGQDIVVVKGLAPENRVVVVAAPLINQIR